MRCRLCGEPMSARADAKYCSDACRVAHWRQRARLRERLALTRRCGICRKRLPVTLRADVRAIARPLADRPRIAVVPGRPPTRPRRISAW
jgi:DNA-binding IclR family transcriptional regulator